MKKILISIFVLLPVLVIGQTTTENYVKTTAYQTETTTGNVTDDNKIETITYYDGIGRPIQSIAQRAGGDREDLVTPIEYDGLGRQPKDYLPLAVTTNSGNFYVPQTGTVYSELKTFYKTKFPDDFYQPPGHTPDWDNPFSEKIFENSLLNRVSEQGAPGMDWRAQYGGEHTIKYDYDTNLTSEVVSFSVDLSGNTPDLESNGYYPAHELHKRRIKDENWIAADGIYGISYEYTNKRGQVVLKRSSVYDPNRTPQDPNYHDTYYVYDDHGNLTFVLSPEGTEQILGSGGALATGHQTILDKLCYQYQYDDRNRLTDKKLPGKEEEFILYDALDRPVLTQDANLRDSDKWLFTKYDDFGRVVYTGIFTDVNGTKRSDMETTLRTPTYTSEERTVTATSIGGTNVYYTNFAYPTADLEVLTVNYYDDYVDMGNSMGTISLPASSYGETISSDTKGLPTVSRVRVLGTSDWTVTATGYDDKGRTIYARSLNEYLDADDIVRTDLDFTGKAIETTTTHKMGSNPILYIYDYFSYDHMGRLKSHTQKLDNEPIQLIAENTYDELGRLERKDVGGETYVLGYTEITNADMTYDGKLVKNTSTNAWDAGAKTKGELLEDGGVSYVISTDDRITQVGLQKTTNGGGWNSYDFGIYHSDQDTNSDNLKDVKLIKNGVLQSTVVAGYEADDAFSVERVGSLVTYKKGSVTIGTVTDTGGESTMIGKASLYHSTAQIEDFTLFGTDLDKKLQNVDYLYNVRGWLTEINDVESAGYGSNYDLFEFRINYNKLEGNASGDKLYNGNIAQTLWKSATDDNDTNIRSYAYGYDDLNRIKTATGYKGTTLALMAANDKHDLSNLDYDQNGNILSLIRKGRDENGSTSGEWDDLAYTYNGNQLTKVDDTAGNGATLKALGFNDGNTGATVDFEYDDNGNMTKDENKNITAIAYNHLNLPTLITVNNGTTATIGYVYDATGMKLQKTLTDGTATSTYYAGNYVYSGSDLASAELQFFNHPEGYVKPVIEIQQVKGSTNGVTTYSAFEYVFQYKDHLGNVRLSYADSNLDGAITPSTEIIEESNFYPFGLKQNGYNNVVSSNGNSLAQKFKTFEGQELDESLNLNWHHFKFRSYDKAIGRFLQIDPLAPTYVYNSTYAFAENNVTSGIDLEGKELSFEMDGNRATGVSGPVAGTKTLQELRSYSMQRRTSLNYLQSRANDHRPRANISLPSSHPNVARWAYPQWGGNIGASVGDAAKEAVQDVALGGVINYGIKGFRALRNAGSVWNLNKFSRGRNIENILGANQQWAKNFPTIDKIDNIYGGVNKISEGVATSIKSLDLTANSYQKGNKVFQTLKGYINKLDSFGGTVNWAGTTVTEGVDYTSKSLELAIETGAGSTSQWEQIGNAIQYALSKDINFTIRFID